MVKTFASPFSMKIKFSASASMQILTSLIIQESGQAKSMLSSEKNCSFPLFTLAILLNKDGCILRGLRSVLKNSDRVNLAQSSVNNLWLIFLVYNRKKIWNQTGGDRFLFILNSVALQGMTPRESLVSWFYDRQLVKEKHNLFMVTKKWQCLTAITHKDFIGVNLVYSLFREIFFVRTRLRCKRKRPNLGCFADWMSLNVFSPWKEL